MEKYSQPWVWRTIYKVVSALGLFVITNLIWTIGSPAQTTLSRHVQSAADSNPPRATTYLSCHPIENCIWSHPHRRPSRRSMPKEATYPLTACSIKLLRWMKLGGQHDCWLKRCPIDSSLPEFLPDIPESVSSLFGITGQMAIVNIYSCGDTQAPHRDISESSRAVLVSVSLRLRGVCHRLGRMMRGCCWGLGVGMGTS